MDARLFFDAAIPSAIGWGLACGLVLAAMLFLTEARRPGPIAIPVVALFAALVVAAGAPFDLSTEERAVWLLLHLFLGLATAVASAIFALVVLANTRNAIEDIR